MHHFIDIILLALLAIFIITRLFTILGQKRENTQDISLESLYRQKTEKKGQEEIILNKKLTNEEKIKLIDSSFNEKNFLTNAEAAIKMIFEAYAEGNTRILSDLVDINIMRNFAYSISKIEEQRHQLHISVINLQNTKIIETMLDKNIATLKVKSDLELTEYLTDNQKVVAGDKNKVESHSLKVEFTKNLNSPDPTWKLTYINYIPFSKEYN